MKAVKELDRLKKALIERRNRGIDGLQEANPEKPRWACVVEWDRGSECPNTTNREMLQMIGVAPGAPLEEVLEGLLWWGIEVTPQPTTPEHLRLLELALDEDVKLSITWETTENGSFVEYLSLESLEE